MCFLDHFRCKRSPNNLLCVVSVELLLFLKAFTESEQTKLAMLTGVLLANNDLPPPILVGLFSEGVVKEGVWCVHTHMHTLSLVLLFSVLVGCPVLCRDLSMLRCEDVQGLDSGERCQLCDHGLEEV